MSDADPDNKPASIDTASLLRLARERYQQGVDGDRDNRRRDELDRRFYKGEQWAAGDLKKRKDRISVTINRCPQFVKQITGEMRQNKPAIRVLPVDDNTDPKLAEVYSAIIRHIESQSDAHRIYSKSGEQAVIGGIGWFRILTDYADGKSFDQEIFVKQVRNPLSVVVDPGAIELTRCDMQWAFVSELIPEDAFKAKYPKASLSGFDTTEAMAAWRADKMVRVAEYWLREPTKRDLLLLDNGQTFYGDELDDAALQALGAQGVQIKAKREVEAFKVKCHKITGVEVLESYDWEGSYIPLVPVVGEEIEVGDDVFRHGLIHHSKDSQRAYNFARSAMLEAVSAQPKAPYLVTTKMVAAHQDAWKQLNEGNPAVLPYDPDPLAPNGPQRIAPPMFAAAWYQEAQTADADMKATTGIYDASLGNRSNETSGKAIIARDQQGETASYVYVDNLSAAIRHCGKMLIELIPEIYTGERVIRMMGEDGSIEGYARINSMLPDGTLENDISVGQFDLEVTTGPAFATKRQQAADALLALVQSVPIIGEIGADMIVKALDIPYGDKLADRLALQLVPPGMDPDVDKKRLENQQQQQQLMGPPQPDPQAQLAQALAAEELKNKAADTALKQAKTENTQVLSAVELHEAHLGAMQAGFDMTNSTGDGPETAKPQP